MVFRMPKSLTPAEIAANRKAYEQTRADYCGIPLADWLDLPEEAKRGLIELTTDNQERAWAIAHPEEVKAKRQTTTKATKKPVAPTTKPKSRAATDRKYAASHRAEKSAKQRAERAAKRAQSV